MKTSYISSLLLILAVLISACSVSQAAQTTDPANVQSTAVAAAATALAETQAAQPSTTAPALSTMTLTETQVPTETPVTLATETPNETPTLESTFTATATTTITTGDNTECIKPLQGLAGGKPAKIKIENNSGFPITVSLFLNKNAFGDCGYRGYALPKGGSILITDLIQGCYSASAVINNPKKPVSAFGYGCINNPDKWSFIVLKDSISLQGR